ncbi:mitochondrial import inner membrane translocase subunit TIM14 [Lecanicillium sp. MT-2017a]|nr:mitochondrial import inner membrane translocase subunit TIM14 [Lecanicillium sp. MT-2017a]
MSSDAVFKVGRGGAGNYYTQQDAPALAAGASPIPPALAQDDAQVQISSSSSSQPQHLWTTGRGGAGNMAGPDAPAPAAYSSSPDEERGRADVGDGSSAASEAAATSAVLIRESHATRMGRLGGRGGAGNWLDKSPARGKDKEKEKEKQVDEEKDELERKGRAGVVAWRRSRGGVGAMGKAFYKGGFEQKMTKKEASLILSLSERTLTKDKVRKAHRTIMLLNHPDRGGSPYLATKVNEAKELLDKQIH